jgi:uncharacterized protein (DUF1330 family)
LIVADRAVVENRVARDVIERALGRNVPQAVACFNSAEYKNAAAFRRDGAAGEAEIALVQPVE